MFKIKQSPTFIWPVAFELPDTGGKMVKHTFDVEFKRMGRAELMPLYDGLPATGGADAFVRAVVVGWSGVTDGDQSVPFSEAAMAHLLDIPTVAGAILHAYTGAIGGEAARKN